ncbi:hypothetical protein U1Q18_040140, partial [Sarracenia purpurea var. burkii]
IKGGVAIERQALRLWRSSNGRDNGNLLLSSVVFGIYGGMATIAYPISVSLSHSRRKNGTADN